MSDLRCSAGHVFTVDEHTAADGNCPKCGIEHDLFTELQAREGTLKSVANWLRGMSMDPGVPADRRAALIEKAAELEETIVLGDSI